MLRDELPHCKCRGHRDSAAPRKLGFVATPFGLSHGLVGAFAVFAGAGEEKCDPMSSTKRCPTAATCDDKKDCTNDVISGTACQAVCTNTMKPNCPSEQPKPSTITCGDGMVTGTEKCDPKSDKKCPTTCVDDDLCTDVKLEGRPTTAARTVHTPERPTATRIRRASPRRAAGMAWWGPVKCAIRGAARLARPAARRRMDA